MKIPAGIRPRAGDPARGPGPARRARSFGPVAGNRIQADGEFEVDGRNVLYTVSLPPWDAALGTTVSVPTLGGRRSSCAYRRIPIPGASCACAAAACRASRRQVIRSWRSK